jgi:hypothetical protein
LTFKIIIIIIIIIILPNLKRYNNISLIALHCNAMHELQWEALIGNHWWRRVNQFEIHNLGV